MRRGNRALEPDDLPLFSEAVVDWVAQVVRGQDEESLDPELVQEVMLWSSTHAP